MAGAIDLFTYRTNLELNDKGFDKSIDKAEKKSKKLSGSLGKLGKVLKVGVVAGIGVASAALVKFAKNATETADKWDKMGQRVGFSTDRLQELDFVLSQNGSSIETFERGVTRLNKNMLDAVNGSKKQAEAFKKLGVSITDSSGKMRGTQEVWEDVIKQLQGMDNEAERNALAMELMGKSAVDLAPMLNAGADSMAELSQKANDMGMVMDEAQIKAGVQLTDSIDQLKRSLGGIANTIGAGVLPAINNMVQFILQCMPQISSAVQTAFTVIGKVLKIGMEIINNLLNVVKNYASQNGEILEEIQEKYKIYFDAVMNLVNVFVVLFQNLWQKYGDNILRIISITLDSLRIIFEDFFNIAINIFNTFSALFSGDWEAFWDNIKLLFANIMIAIQHLLENGLNLLIEIIKLVFPIMKETARQLFLMLKQGFVEIWEIITTWLHDKFNALIGWLNSLGETFYNIGLDIINWMWDGLKSMWDNVQDWFSDKIKWIKEKLRFWEKSQEKMSKSSSRGSTFKKSSSSIATHDPKKFKEPIYRNKIPAYDVGTLFVPNNQIAMIHKGEAIIPAKYNPFNNTTQNMQNRNNQPTTTKQTINISKLEFPNVHNGNDVIHALKQLPRLALQK